MNLLFTLVALRLVDRFGRKPLMIIGAAGMTLAHAGLGIAAYNNMLGAWVLILVLGFIAFFAMSLGPIVWIIIAEVFPTRIRGRGMAIASLLLWGTNYVMSQTFPMINESPWLVATFGHAFPFMLYGSFCLLTVFFVPFRRPRDKGEVARGNRKTLEALKGMRMMTPPTRDTFRLRCARTPPAPRARPGGAPDRRFPLCPGNPSHGDLFPVGLAENRDHREGFARVRFRPRAVHTSAHGD